MRIGAVLSPTGDWPAILEAAQLADRHGLDAIGFWDHYHSERPDWTYVCGWSAYGALAQVQLTEAACTPAPPRPPRIVVGVGHSRRLIRSAVRYADELNLYASEDMLRYARQAIAESERPIDISVYLHFDWGQWPADLAGVLAKWEDQVSSVRSSTSATTPIWPSA
jgi:alkanesulfonate monooxygenase SsuD/methylene tetrahydromethanopterin reductase-like flavin-dependent oxidoreductase (luciferase family)